MAWVSPIPSLLHRTVLGVTISKSFKSAWNVFSTVLSAPCPNLLVLGVSTFVMRGKLQESGVLCLSILMSCTCDLHKIILLSLACLKSSAEVLVCSVTLIFLCGMQVLNPGISRSIYIWRQDVFLAVVLLTFSFTYLTIYIAFDIGTAIFEIL